MLPSISWGEIAFFAVTCLALASTIGAAFKYPYGNPVAWRRLPSVVTFAVPPAAIVVWEQIFWHRNGDEAPFWVTDFILVMIVVSAVLPLVVARFTVGARWFSIWLGLLALAITLIVAFVATMAVTGDWI